MYTSTANYIDIGIDIFVNYDWVDTLWQYTFTNKQYINNNISNYVKDVSV
jgi:hypothetical protein